jgi:phosphatidylglycerol:prolipoprotein diacylglycerol transferase
MYPILARYGPFFLYSYTVVMALGILAGLGLAIFLGNRDGIKSEHWINGLLLGVIVGLIFGRVVFVLANVSYYLENPSEIPLIWRGGLSYHGVLIAGLIFIGAWTRFKGHASGQIALLLAPSLALFSSFGWLACWLDGCAYGRQSAAGFLVADLPDSFGVFALRYSTQLLALVLCLLIFTLTLSIRQYRRIRWLPWLTLLLLSAGRLVVSLLRGDSVPMLGPIRMDTIAEGLLIIFCLIAIPVIIFRKPAIENRTA